MPLHTECLKMIGGFTRGKLLKVFAVSVASQGLGTLAMVAALGHWRADFSLQRSLGMAASFLFLGLIWTGFGFLFSQVFPLERRQRVAYIIVAVLAMMLASIGFFAER